MPTTIETFSNARVQPVKNPQDARTDAVILKASTTFPAGQVLAKKTSDGKCEPVVTTALAAPAAGLTVAAAGSDGSLATGVYKLVYTKVDALGGETTPSPQASVTVGSTNHIAITTVALPTGAASLRIYMTQADGSDFHLIANAWDGTGYNLLADVVSVVEPPQVNTASVGTGVDKPVGILPFACKTDSSSNVYIMSSGTAAADYRLTPYREVQIYIGGTFDTADLTGWDSAVGAYLQAKTGPDGYVTF